MTRKHYGSFSPPAILRNYRMSEEAVVLKFTFVLQMRLVCTVSSCLTSSWGGRTKTHIMSGWTLGRLPLKASLSHVFTAHGKQTQCFQGWSVFPLQQPYAYCICRVLILDLWVQRRCDMCVCSHKRGNAAKINRVVAASLCALYRQVWLSRGAPKGSNELVACVPDNYAAKHTHTRPPAPTVFQCKQTAGICEITASRAWLKSTLCCAHETQPCFSASVHFLAPLLLFFYLRWSSLSPSSRKPSEPDQILQFLRLCSIRLGSNSQRQLFSMWCSLSHKPSSKRLSEQKRWLQPV